MSLVDFNAKWGSSSYPPEPVSEAELRKAELLLAVCLPEDYRDAVLRVGLPRPTIALLDAIVERELELHSVGDFYSPTEIVEETFGWREIGMPAQLVGFASDGSGNKFCFDAGRLNEGGAEAGAVWFYDHDFGTVDQIAPSFDAWITTLCEIDPWPSTETM